MEEHFKQDLFNTNTRNDTQIFWSHTITSSYNILFTLFIQISFYFAASLLIVDANQHANIIPMTLNNTTRESHKIFCFYSKNLDKSDPNPNTNKKCGVCHCFIFDFFVTTHRINRSASVVPPAILRWFWWIFCTTTQRHYMARFVPIARIIYTATFQL